MSTSVRPDSFQDIAEVCRTSPCVLPVGGATKPSLLLHAGSADVTRLDMRSFSGVVTYDPSEFLISARAGTTIAELNEVLTKQGQYLPFDPVLAEEGATLGGSIASGISGPCRLLYGSLRDFMLEVQLCDSVGNEVRGGGKVVKNAAGFDLPKLVVGSYGRMGIITEATLKVFPKPAGGLTLTIPTTTMRTALEIATKLLALPLAIAALEIDTSCAVVVRLAGPVDSLAGMASRILAALPTRLRAERLEHGSAESDWWRQRAELAWCRGAAALARVAVVHHQCAELWQALTQLDGCRCVVSCGATVAWIAVDTLEQLPTLDALLAEQKLSGVAIRGPESLTVLGDRRWIEPATRIQSALDPGKKWLAYA